MSVTRLNTEPHRRDRNNRVFQSESTIGSSGLSADGMQFAHLGNARGAGDVEDGDEDGGQDEGGETRLKCDYIVRLSEPRAPKNSAEQSRRALNE